MRRELRILTEALREGKKVTERKKAVDEITRWFSSTSNVKKVGSNNDEWVEIFDALAIGAKDEHDLAARKTSKATDGKLEGISAAFRTVVEASVPYLNNASLEYLIPRLVAILKFSGALDGATGSNYARALLSITSHPPHVRSLSDKFWYYIARSSWAILLGDKMSGRLGWEEEDPKLQPRPSKPNSSGAGSLASPVQLIFATIIRHICSSPFAPLIERHRRTSEEDEEETERDDLKTAAQAKWANYLLVKFCRYFEMYTGAVTSHVDMIPALCHVLSVVELNRIEDMMWFSRRIWPRLVALMKGRVRTDYVHLIIVFKIILPYYTRVVKDDGKVENPVELVDSSSFHGLMDLVQVIDQSAPLKAGIECLSLESLRLEFTPRDVDAFTGFRAKVFQHGPAFASSQAHSWAALELQADCAYSLFRQEELSMQSHFTSEGPPTKRRRSENAIELLLREVKEATSQNYRLFRLQTLLMLIERHWTNIDSTHQQSITTTLVRALGTDDLIDPFILLCFATLAASSERPTAQPSGVTSSWANLWVHGYRMLVSQSPQVSRAAAHLLCALLKRERVDSTMVNQHIGQFIRDFRDEDDVVPCETLEDIEKARLEASLSRQTIKFSTITESLCDLLSRFISIADADASLCRLQLEDSVRKWLRQSLSHTLLAEKARRGTIRTGKGNNDVDKLRKPSLRPDSHVNAQDILGLLQAICGLSTKPTLRCDVRLPSDGFIRTIIAYQADRALRRFVLEVKVPEFVHSIKPLRDPFQQIDTGTQRETITSPVSSLPTTGEYAPSARESKTLLMLEDALRRLLNPSTTLTPDGTAIADGTYVAGVASVEKASVTIKVVSAVLGLQGSLELNGTRPSVNLYRLAFKVLRSAAPWSEVTSDSQNWLAKHWPAVLVDFRPLAWMGSSIVDSAQRQVEQFMLRPGTGSGIKRELARHLSPDPVELRRRSENDASFQLLNTIWRQRSASDFLEVVNEALQVLLRSFVDAASNESVLDGAHNNANFFSASSTADGMGMMEQSLVAHDTDGRDFVSVSVSLISTTSMVSRTGGNSGNDPWLDQIVLDAEGPAFLSLGRAWCDSIRAGTLHASPATVRRFLDSLSQKLKIWELWRSEVMHGLVFQFLDLLTPVWLSEGGEMRRSVEKLFPRWAEKKIMDGGSWISRLHFVSFLASHLSHDKAQRWWKEMEAERSMELDDQSMFDEEGSPRDLLGDLMLDGDIRVRFISSILYPVSFQQAGDFGLDVMAIYNKSMTPKLPADPSWFEGMLTRFVALANTMVVSSPLRRGVYWHLIEVTLDDSYYTRYLVPLLEGIARRLGLGGIQSLFRAYAAQIAVQAQNGPSDFLHLPPRVLGYRTHKECSDSTFSIVLPITIVTSLVTSDQKGQKSYGSVLKNSFFDRYCKTVRQEPIHALKECFSQLVAGFIIFNQEGSLPRTRGESYPLREWIIQCARECDKGADPEQYVRIRADSIVASILCFGGDIDYHPDGSIVEALRRSDPSAAEVFIRLNKFRRFNDFPMHMVNFPAASTDAVLNSLKWFTDTFVDKLEHGLGMATIYHATHHLFAAVLSTPLVNEQLRYIHSLSLWLAISAAILDQPPMMRMLLTHSLALLPQEDLTHSAQSIISWTLEQTRHSESSGSDIELSIVISRIAELGVQFSRSPDQPTLDIGHDLLDWIEKELQTLRESVEIRRILEPTITLWPRTLNGQSQFSTDSREFIDAQTVGVLSAGQQRLLGRFRAVRHLNSIPLYATYTFAADHFWTLKTSIPDDSLLLQEDIDAFTELLSKSSGHFQPVRSELPEEDRLTDRQRANAQQSIKLVIVQWLLDLMAVATSSSLHIIHGTLRLLCHPKCGEPGTTDHPVLSLFRVGALDPIHATPCEPSDLKRSSFRNLASDYSRWISDITVFLARLLAKVDIFYGQLPPLLISETSFAANLLPILVHQLLICDRKEPFLGSLRPLLSTYIRSIIHSDSAETAVREAVLNIILHLRHFSRPDGNDPLGHDKWLDLDFLELCRTSLSCGAYTTSLLFLELAEEYRIGDGKKKKPQIDNNWDQEKEDVLYEIYRHIDEPDGFYAIKGRDIQKHLMHKFHHEKKWAKAFQSHVSQYEGVRNGDNTVNDERQGLPGVIQSLHSFGFNQLAMSLARGATTVSSADLAYSLAWRTETWDLPQAANPSLPSSFLYGVMRSVHRGRNVSITQNLCDKAVRWEMQQLRSTNVENVVEIRRVIQSLLCLREVKQWLNEWRLLNSQSLSHSDSFLKFSQLSSELDFETAEGIVATRISLAHSLKQSIKGSQIGDMEGSLVSSLTDLETRCLVNLAAIARISNMPQVAYNAVSRAQQVAAKPVFHISKEFSEALWAQQEHAMAIQFLTELISQKKSLNQDGPVSHRMDIDSKPQELQGWALLHARLGSWTSAAFSANPSDIRTKYFDPAVNLLDPLDQIRRRAAKMVYYQYADFANKQLRQMEGSEDYRLQKDWVAKIQAEIRDLDTMAETAKSTAEKEEIKRRREKASRLLETDKKNVEEHESATKSFLQQAISMYAHYMEASDEQDEEIAVRFCGLWFAKFESDIAAESIRHALQKISTHKLLFLSHQLTARLGTWSSGEGAKRNQRFLHQLVEGMCIQHPYHCLIQVLTAKGLEITSKKGRSNEPTPDMQAKRQEEAKKIIESVRNSTRQGSKRPHRPDNFMEQMEDTFKGYIEFAAYPIKSMQFKSGSWHPISKSVGLYRYTWDGKSKAGKPSPLSIPVVTASLPIEMGGKYLGIPTIQYYQRVFTVAGGVHVPKIAVCMDSTGKLHKQLFKGEGDDDLRQDAVMQQVFQLVNIILAQDRESKRRELSLRTYKVIPLPHQTGLLQFVNAETMASWLYKAHARYNSDDMPMRETQDLLKQHGKNATFEEKYKIFMKVRERFHPVLRHYFTESNKQPVVWYAKRLTYSRSAAACSIVGHVLGLGDRHISNLMMDARTGEMIHIDFGIAFDQGRYLPVPELVPFRLTADIIDGMGIAGTEGVFRRCSEETLRVLREGADIIRTVLEVFKYDPLHSWTATPAKLRRVQDVDEVTSDDGGALSKAIPGSEHVHQGAERAINSVTRKLDPYLSVEYTVNELINAARDPANLARIYWGWGPQF